MAFIISPPRAKCQIQFSFGGMQVPPQAGVPAPSWCHDRQGIHAVFCWTLKRSGTALARRPFPASHYQVCPMIPDSPRTPYRPIVSVGGGPICPVLSLIPSHCSDHVDVVSVHPSVWVRSGANVRSPLHTACCNTLARCTPLLSLSV